MVNKTLTPIRARSFLKHPIDKRKREDYFKKQLSNNIHNTYLKIKGKELIEEINKNKFVKPEIKKPKPSLSLLYASYPYVKDFDEKTREEFLYLLKNTSPLKSPKAYLEMVKALSLTNPELFAKEKTSYYEIENQLKELAKKELSKSKIRLLISSLFTFSTISSYPSLSHLLFKLAPQHSEIINYGGGYVVEITKNFSELNASLITILTLIGGYFGYKAGKEFLNIKNLNSLFKENQPSKKLLSKKAKALALISSLSFLTYYSISSLLSTITDNRIFKFMITSYQEITSLLDKIF